jgi:hypothetical protein
VRVQAGMQVLRLRGYAAPLRMTVSWWFGKCRFLRCAAE